MNRFDELKNKPMSVYVIEEFLGMMHGRAILKIKDSKHDIQTKRIIHVDVIAQSLMTSDSVYIVKERDTIITTQELFNIYNDIEYYKKFGENQLCYLNHYSLEKPNEIMKKCFK